MSDSNVCPLYVSQSDVDAFSQCEAVVVREYQNDADFSRFANVVAWGDEDEMREAADTPGLFVVPTGHSIIGQFCKRVDELLA